MTKGFHFVIASELSKTKRPVRKVTVNGKAKEGIIRAFTRQRKIIMKKHMIKQPLPQWKKKKIIEN